MSEQATRTPYDHTLHAINETAQALRGIEALPGGQPRALTGSTAIGALTVRSNLAIASALLAVADALRPLPTNTRED